MYQEERLYQIMNLLREKKSLSKQEIMERFNISRDTARRDIICLINQKIAIRTHGGIILPTIQVRQSFKERATIKNSTKDLLGKVASTYIKKNAICYLDTSTTVQSICKYIKQKSIIYSNSIDIIEQLQHDTSLDLHLLGGKLNPINRYFYGSETSSILENIRFDIAFLGAASITEDGFYTFENEDAAIKHLVAKNSTLTCVLADSAKFLLQPAYKFGNLADVDIVLTTKMPPKAIVTALAKANCSLLWDFNDIFKGEI